MICSRATRNFEPLNTAYIGLGSNLGDSLQVVMDAWATLGTVHGIYLGRLSHPFQTEPVGMVSDKWFVNAAGELKTRLTPPELLHQLHRIEKMFGRKRDPAVSGYLDRILDLDLLLYDKVMLAENDVIIPHPSLQDRLFVLLPLAEIAADVHHPVIGKTIGDLLTVLENSGQNQVVKRVEWPRNAGVSFKPQR